MLQTLRFCMDIEQVFRYDQINYMALYLSYLLMYNAQTRTIRLPSVFDEEKR